MLIFIFSCNELIFHKNELKSFARIEAQASYNKDLVYRRWAAEHGGVYVPISENTPPNSYLQNIPDRDVTTPSGEKLTLINPAYMTRQVYEIASRQYGVMGHITSLKPLRPENSPDRWEENALKSFESGQKTVETITLIDGKEYFRMMFPMMTETACLKCHADQGYRVADIRGGISVSVPMHVYNDIFTELLPSHVVYYGFVWFFGSASLLYARRKVSKESKAVERALEVSERTFQMLGESEERFHKMFSEHNAVMMLLDPDTGDIIDANKSAIDFYGYSADDFKNMSIQQITLLSDAESAEVRAKAVCGEQSYFVTRHKLLSGVIKDVEVHTSSIKLMHQDVLFNIVHDISERNKLMEEQSRSAQLAALGTVAAGVAHEINNPIQGIMNYSELLAMQAEENDSTKEISRRIIDESERIAKITSNLLNYAKDNREEILLSDVKNLVESATSLIATKIRHRKITLEIDARNNLPLVKLQPQSFQQVILNLIDNAYDAIRYKKEETGDGLINLRADVVEKDNQPFLSVEVRDNGIGMSSDIVEKARNAFFTTKPSSEGTGLGLSIVMDIMKKHDGSMEIESEENHGTSIKVYFPTG